MTQETFDAGVGQSARHRLRVAFWVGANLEQEPGSYRRCSKDRYCGELRYSGGNTIA